MTGAHRTRVQNSRIHLPKPAWSSDPERGTATVVLAAYQVNLVADVGRHFVPAVFFIVQLLSWYLQKKTYWTLDVHSGRSFAPLESKLLKKSATNNTKNTKIRSRVSYIILV